MPIVTQSHSLHIYGHIMFCEPMSVTGASNHAASERQFPASAAKIQ